jgi:hypothetical protein
MAVPFSSFLLATIIAQLISGIPTIAGILLFNLIDAEALAFILIPIAALSIPISAALSWLVAKGSNWENTTTGITAACGLPGKVYGIFFGGLLGSRLYGPSGGVILAVLLYFVAHFTTIPLGKILTRRILLRSDTQL